MPKRQSGENGEIAEPARFLDASSHLYRPLCLSLRLSVRLSVHPSVRPAGGVRCHKIFFSLKSPWNHPLTPGVDPRCAQGTRPLGRS